MLRQLDTTALPFETFQSERQQQQHLGLSPSGIPGTPVISLPPFAEASASPFLDLEDYVPDSPILPETVDDLDHSIDGSAISLNCSSETELEAAVLSLTPILSDAVTPIIDASVSTSKFLTLDQIDTFFTRDMLVSDGPSDKSTQPPESVPSYPVLPEVDVHSSKFAVVPTSSRTVSTSLHIQQPALVARPSSAASSKPKAKPSARAKTKTCASPSAGKSSSVKRRKRAENGPEADIDKKLRSMFTLEQMQAETSVWNAIVAAHSLTDSELDRLGTLRRRAKSCLYAEKSRSKQVQQLHEALKERDELLSQNMELRSKLERAEAILASISASGMTIPGLDQLLPGK